MFEHIDPEAMIGFYGRNNCENTSGGPMRYEQLSQPPKVNDSIKKEGMKPTIPEVGSFFLLSLCCPKLLVFASYPLFTLFFAHELAILAGSV